MLIVQPVATAPGTDVEHEGGESCNFYEQVGGFGTILIHAGRPYATPAKLARSMELFMREVAPKLRPIDPDLAPASVAAE